MFNLNDIFTYNERSPMLFTKMAFWIFFAIVLIVYSFIYKKNNLRTAWLFLASLFFYFKSSGFFFILLIFSTVSDFFLAQLIHKSPKKHKKKIWLSLSIFINLSLLGYFKYSYLITDFINSLFNTSFKTINYLAMISNNLTGSSFNIEEIFLPVGISFFTFQTISYAVDVYRKEVEPVNNIIDFGFYVSFFPQLVAGPIVRASQFIPQLKLPYSLTRQQFGHAFFLILNGLVKKVIVSDYISANFVDRIFSEPGLYTGFENLMAVYGYSIQIYCDFSGYTDIAIGVAMLLGFRLPINFNSPYKAINISDFWRRWHISLSSWLRDYLYIPLGGNRKGRIRTNINLLITMVLGGLWHGASIRFLLWGALHGFGLIVNKAIFKFGVSKNNSSFIKIISGIITFHFVSFAWIFFRAQNFAKAKDMIHAIINNSDSGQILPVLSGYTFVFVLILWAYIFHFLPSQFKEEYRGLFIKLPLIIKIFIFVLLAIVIYQFNQSGMQPFIYFRF